MELGRTGLQGIVTLTSAALILVFAGIVGLVTGARSERQLQEEIGRSLKEAAFQMAERLDTDMWARSNHVSVLARVSAMRDWAVAQTVVNELKATDHTLAWVGVTDRQGRVMASSGGVLLGADLSGRPVFQNGIRGHFVGDVHDAVLLARLLPNPTGEAMKFVDVSTPLKDESGETVGVLATHFSWAWAREVRDILLAPMRQRQGVDLFIIGADGVVLLGPDSTLGTAAALTSVDLARAERARGGLAGWTVERWGDGRDYLTGYAASPGHGGYPGLGWTVLARQPVDVAFAGARALRWEILGWGAGGALLFSVLAWAAAGRIVRPVRAIAGAAARLRRGEPGVEIPEVRGAWELTEMSRALRGMVATLTDTRHALARMEDMAYQDRLTGLPNRRFFDQYVEGLATRTGGQPYAVLYLDLDGFKPVNDTLGHPAGDAVLRQVAARLAAALRAEDVVARLGGDEFVVILNSHGTGEPLPPLGAITARLIATVNEPLVIQGQVVRVGCSIGVAVGPAETGSDRGAAVQTVLDRADSALYAAKRAGRNRAVTHEDGYDAAPTRIREEA
ncbi:GGDEF domain-containing protein [Azospirillum fermentarium]|uniref:GGDEF domain-containing protein n=1 Tax=Azospirillum fermentarium TaxID=1233114 RepID=UPI002226861D|nr:GGDEF domain-containing protein [Azospirillum fermentarium]